jgi:carbonic anhydrase/acetyltransferase-like protein (isoleucine patch superfamily)
MYTKKRYLYLTFDRLGYLELRNRFTSSSGPKFKLLENEFIDIDGRRLFRIQALRDFGHSHHLGVILEGMRGGFVESEANLSHDGNAWIAGKACAFDNALVRDDARLIDEAKARDHAHVSGDAIVSGRASLRGNSRVSDNARVSGDALLVGSTRVCDFANVSGNALLSDSLVEGSASVREYARIIGSRLRDQTKAFGFAVMHHATLSGNARAFDKAFISNGAHISGDAQVIEQGKVIAKLHLTGNASVRGATVIDGNALQVTGVASYAPPAP